MKSRYWITLSLRVIGLVLIGITLSPVAANFGRIAHNLYDSPKYFWRYLDLHRWTGDAVLLALGLYILLGNGVVNRILRDLDAGRRGLTGRSWVSVVLGLIGLVLILITAKPIATEIGQVTSYLLRGRSEDIERHFNPAEWTQRLVVIGLGMYLFLGGTWLVNRIFRGLGDGRCAECGYDLTGLDDGAECPECGKPTETKP